ncbi:MAG: indolepyruvate ferredoxin oxidoreductase subunit alpha [Promethearchaeota archaeon]
MSQNDEDVYRRLQQHLDNMPVGFPAAESGAEIRLLKHLFTPDEAALALKLTFTPEPVKRIFRRVRKTGISVEELEAKLDRMVEKGCLNAGKNPQTGEKFYANAFFAIGMFEYQVGKLTREFVEDMEQYLQEAFIGEFYKTGIPQLRTIPIEASVEDEKFVSTYDEVRKIFETRSPISVAECVCEQAQKLRGSTCHHETKERCFQFGTGAHYYVENGLAREISKEEALEILDKVQEEGLVLQPTNSQKPIALCCCCGNCCEVLTHAKKLPKPAELFSTNHYSEVDPDACSGCGVCEERCPMDAVTLDDGVAHINRDYCIGCGVCIPTCPSDAIHLRKKDKEIVPPRNTMEMYTKMMHEKAKLAREEKGKA